MSFIPLIKPYRYTLLLILGCIFLSNILALSLPWGIKIIIDEVLKGSDAALLGRIVWVLLAILSVRTALNFWHKYMSGIVGERIVADLRSRLYARVHGLPLLSVRRMAPSQILTRFTCDIDSVRRFVFADALEFVYAVFSVLAIGCVLAWMNVRLAAYALATLPFFAAIYFCGVPRLKEYHGRLREAYGRMTSRVSEVLGGMSTVKAFGGEAGEQGIFEARQRIVLRDARQTHRLNTALWIASEFLTSAGILCVVWAGSMDVLAGRMTPGGLVAFYSYLGMLFAPLIRMIVIRSAYQEASAAMERIADVLDTRDELTRALTPVVLSPLRGEIVFENVGFGYDASRPVLKNISFRVAPGETVAVIGPSGSGKSTLVGLLLRLFDAREGRVWVDGQDMRSLDLEDYRRQVAVVLQDDFLFQDSVAENIGYACRNVSRQAIVEAAQAAQAHDFIAALPDGYDTGVGERGALLSCGQRQRIAIARALVRQPKILILDEATASVDAMTENIIQKSVRGFGGVKTIFIVAHRFSTIMEADRIIVLQDGMLADMGSHQELLEKSVFYRQLYMEQFKATDDVLSSGKVLA